MTIGELNRKITPEYHQIKEIPIIRAEKHHLSNNVPLYTINAGSLDIIKIEFIFKAGSWFEPIPLVSSATNAMLNEGTTNRTSEQISETFDYYGAFFHLNVDKDTASIVLFTLKKYLSETLTVIEDIIKNSIFPEKEFEVYINKLKQHFIIEKNKVKTLARDKFLESLFGKDHPYGSEISLENFDQVTTDQLIDFYKKFYYAKNCQIIVAGKIDSNLINIFEKYFGENDWKGNGSFFDRPIPVTSPKQGEYYVKKDKAVQSAIRIGKVLFNKLHPDYPGMLVLNTILGGYFGSRLMKNIREEKGYTYGISSLIISLHHSGYLTIVSEVGADVYKKAIREIYKEIKILREKPVPYDELTLVKNYLLGELLRMFDGPFALADSFRSILEYELNYDFYMKTIETIKNISPEEIITLARKYLHEGSFTQVVAGK
ncbi:MAG: insulinase family protein [Bacteroidales bacterium]|nr:insulinase family protein [Bacteroidales bacterium]